MRPAVGGNPLQSKILGGKSIQVLFLYPVLYNKHKLIFLPPPIPPTQTESAVTPFTVAREGRKRQLDFINTQEVNTYHLTKLTFSCILHHRKTISIIVNNLTVAYPYPLSVISNSMKAGEFEILCGL